MSTERKVVALGLLLTAFVSGVVLSRTIDEQETVAADVTTAPTTPEIQGRGASLATTGGLPDLSSVAERAAQASVNIASTTQQRVNDPFYRMLYGDAVPSNALGSGVFVSSDGYVVTNSHVVQDRRAEIRVTLSDNREAPARIIGVDPDSDVAVLKVDARGITPLPWGDSAKLRVAEWVLAVGNPFQFNQTVTLGIVSAVNRHDPQDASFTDFIQTDAAINPGNSGGPLVNAKGELVGINTMIVSNTGGYQGLGFAVPANQARRIMEELIKNGEITRGSIGNLTLRSITAEQARNNRLGDRAGVFVASMFRNDPAYLAGIVPRDVIIRYNGQDVTEQGQLSKLISESRIGSAVRVEVLRNGTPRTFNVDVVRRVPPQGR